MDETEFEDKLMELIAAGRDGGLDLSSIVSALELRIYALREEEESEETSESE